MLEAGRRFRQELQGCSQSSSVLRLRVLRLNDATSPA